MFEKELIEIANAKRATRNLRYALIAVGLLIFAGLIMFLIIDSLAPMHNRILTWFLVLVYYGLLAASAIIAIIAFKWSQVGIRTYKNYRNFIALGLSIFVLVMVANEIFQRL